MCTLLIGTRVQKGHRLGYRNIPFPDIFPGESNPKADLRAQHRMSGEKHFNSIQLDLRGMYCGFGSSPVRWACMGAAISPLP